jgi:lysophospholipid acyltransferase (LPLAT)-like uncharacterized protein
MRIRGPLVNWVVAGCAVWLFRALFLTVRIRYRQFDPRTNPYTGSGPAVVFSVWHDAMVFSIFAGRHARSVALVSKHQDGSFLARGLAMLGIGIVRGSSGRWGASAMRRLLLVSRDRNVVITPDGPRGPRRQAKPGMVFLASRSGRAVVPAGFAAVSSWRIRGNWTDLEIPKPFTTIYYLTGEPISVPADASRDVVAAYESSVQGEMDRLTVEAARLAASHRGD